MVEKLFEELSGMPEVEAIALGGSRAGANFDEKSDYDVYLYCTSDVDIKVRKEILSKYCDVMELGNHFWEYEDNCILKNGIDIDILYRNLDDFVEDVASVVEKCQERNGYTTCMWHNLRTCKVIYDENNRLTKAKKRFDVSYPAELKKNIIERNMKLLYKGLPAYSGQVLKAAGREDKISVIHRSAGFFESYFDIIFAINEMTHPGEKRMVSICVKECKILPEDFEKNIEEYYENMFKGKNAIEGTLEKIVKNLQKVVDNLKLW
ncbi:MAG: DUF4037 domain-containing protein [Lachnospiraceae bacterium]|nr:DUF4037 domain-containing protein [Lachnospiraceae bacterium]